MRWYILPVTYLVNGSLSCLSKLSFSEVNKMGGMQEWVIFISKFGKHQGKYAKHLAFCVFTFILLVIVRNTQHCHSHHFLHWTEPECYEVFMQSATDGVLSLTTSCHFPNPFCDPSTVAELFPCTQPSIISGQALLKDSLSKQSAFSAKLIISSNRAKKGYHL